MADSRPIAWPIPGIRKRLNSGNRVPLHGYHRAARWPISALAALLPSFPRLDLRTLQLLRETLLRDSHQRPEVLRMQRHAELLDHPAKLQ